MANQTGALPPNAMSVDLDAIRHNVRAVRAEIGGGVTLLAAVKADAYGFGVFTVAPVVLSAGADGLALASVADAVALRAAGIHQPILLYGGTRPGTVIDDVVRNDLMVTILDEADVRACGAAGARIMALVEVDVGLERLGTTPSEALNLARQIHRHPTLELAGVYTHMHVPKGPVDEIKAYVAWEFQRFGEVLSRLEAEGIPVPIKLAASSGTLRLTDTMTLNAVDVGSLLYGLEPPGPAHRAMDLRPALISVTSRLTQVKVVERRDYVARSPIPVGRPVRLGVIPMGSSDGLLGFSAGHVLVRGHRAPVLAVSLEHTRLDLTGIDDAEAGDEVVIVGSQADDAITVREVFELHNLATPAAVPSLVGARIERRYAGAVPALVGASIGRDGA